MNRKEFSSLATRIMSSWSPPKLPLASSENLMLLRHGFIAWCALSEDILPDVTGTSLEKWLNNVSTYSFDDVMHDCDLACSRLVRLERSCMSAFKGQDYHTVTRKTLAPIWEELLRVPGDLQAYERCYQWLRFLRKLPLDNPELKQKSLEKWVQIEEHISTPTPLIKDEEAKCFSRPFTKKVDRTRFRPFHGGGRVAEQGLATYYDKYMLAEPVPPLPGLHTGRWCYPPIDRRAKLVSRLTFVPKTINSLRAIAMEPAGLMWYQQGWKSIIYDLIEKSSQGAIHFSDQRFNQRLAKWASKHGQYATIDFSSASDCVRFDVVQQLLKYADPTWQAILLKGRSTHCQLPDGSVVHLNKYAPMGSTFCFPVESMLFYSVAYSLMRERYGTTQFGPEILIFGDDCIVPEVIADQFMERTRELGFIPNEGKTFTTGSFRESCGCDCIKGTVITPLLYRVPPKEGRIQSITALANHAALRGYRRLREFSISLLPSNVAFGEDIESGDSVYSPNPYSTKYRYNEDLQYLQELRYSNIEYGAARSLNESDILVQEWLRIRDYTEPEYMPDLHTALIPAKADRPKWISLRG